MKFLGIFLILFSIVFFYWFIWRKIDNKEQEKKFDNIGEENLEEKE